MIEMNKFVLEQRVKTLNYPPPQIRKVIRDNKRFGTMAFAFAGATLASSLTSVLRASSSAREGNVKNAAGHAGAAVLSAAASALNAIAAASAGSSNKGLKRKAARLELEEHIFNIRVSR